MVELLDFLRANGFKTFIVSGGGIEFMRAISEPVYGIPPEQVIGSTGKVQLRAPGRRARCSLSSPRSTSSTTRPASRSRSGKFIGRRPIAAFGNSDGDQQMLQWTAAGPDRSLAVLVNHTDAEREFEYRVSPMGRLDLALDRATTAAGRSVGMKDDWSRVFPFE